ncbi:MAG: DUF3352 domain-containing protein [Actinomycetota bacterium]|nr:DUF3352 domain-containing protein [Actinomycetota bacterium]
MRLRALAVCFAATLVLAAGACGGSDNVTGADGAGSDAAEFVPANAPAFVTVNTDFDSDAWQNLEALLDKFPDRERFFAEVRDGLQASGVTFDEIKAALGPETALAVLALETGEPPLFLTEAEDQAKLDALIRKLEESDEGSGSENAVKEVVDGWTLLSERQSSIDAAKRAHEGDSIADSERFDEAMGDLSGDAVVRFFADGAALSRQLDAQSQGAASSLAGGGRLESIAGQMTAAEDGLGFDFVTRTEGGAEPENFEAELLSAVPADALLYASFKGLGERLEQASSNPRLQQQLGMVQGVLGISVSELADLFRGEAALYVRPGAPFPEVTLTLAVENEQQSLAMVDRLAQRLARFAGGGAPTATRIGDVDAKQLRLQNFAVYYAAFDGKLVITSATTGISEQSGGGDKLEDDATFQAATEAAEMPDETAGFLYVDIADAVPLLESFAQTAGEPLPSETRANLEPLRSALFYATAEEGKARVKGFLRIE